MHKMLVIIGMLLTLAGCATEMNRTPTTAENETLSRTIQLTNGFDRTGEAYFSKDMQWIVFQATPPGEQQYQMYVAKLRYEEVPASSEGIIVYATPLPFEVSRIAGIGTPIRISPANSRNTCGYFSPDGLSIILASTAGKEDPSEPQGGYQREGRDYRWSYPTGMEIYRADGWQGAVSAAEPGKIIDLAKFRLTENNAYDAECAFSPDGKQIIFTSNRTGDLELFVMKPDGTGVTQLTHTPGYDGGPFFSPDGKRIVYRSDRLKKDFLQVYTADLTFDPLGNIKGIENERQLTHDLTTVNWGPFWHPDGKHIIYGTSILGHENYELYLMRSDGTHKTRITFTAGADVLPVFSPDGKYLMWTSNRNGQTTQVYLSRFRVPPGA